MHSPAEINVQDTDELVAPLGKCVTADGRQEGGYIDVGSDDGVENPFHAKVCNALQSLFEWVKTGDCDGTGRS